MDWVCQNSFSQQHLFEMRLNAKFQKAGWDLLYYLDYILHISHIQKIVVKLVSMAQCVQRWDSSVL